MIGDVRSPLPPQTFGTSAPNFRESRVLKEGKHGLSYRMGLGVIVFYSLETQYLTWSPCVVCSVVGHFLGNTDNICQPPWLRGEFAIFLVSGVELVGLVQAKSSTTTIQEIRNGEFCVTHTAEQVLQMHCPIHHSRWVVDNPCR